MPRKSCSIVSIRNKVQVYEESLAASQRKRLGQYFSGMRLGKLLAHVALQNDTRTVLDPMAGHGDLLEAAWVASKERDLELTRLDGIEIDPDTASICNDRLNAMAEKETRLPFHLIEPNSAFSSDAMDHLPLSNYDLVITNPPYVRYQTSSENDPKSIRAFLNAHVDRTSLPAEVEIWKSLVNGYSGLADLSVPSWLLAALMVRPGGRLAIVVPATWRSRDYADIIRYMLLRCFELEYVVEDTQPGWFSDALVRTHLIVARRLDDEELRIPCASRQNRPDALWIQIAPSAGNELSLVGTIGKNEKPEQSFSRWLAMGAKKKQSGIDVKRFDLKHEQSVLASRAGKHRWYKKLEPMAVRPPLLSDPAHRECVTLPDEMMTLLPQSLPTGTLISLDQAGIRVGQGLRTGCNRFFYVTNAGEVADGMELVTTSCFGKQNLRVPSDVLRSVLHRQAEVELVTHGANTSTSVLDLRRWVLPEDATTTSTQSHSNAANPSRLPTIMPHDLATYVRRAAIEPLKGDNQKKRVPDLSAVRTNIRFPKNGKGLPRFWYMLPDFTDRHQPAAFVPRIIHEMPWVECNLNPPLLVDANFSTFWTEDKSWTPFSIKALLNSSWCRAYLECAGTLFGGGALKVEATHLRFLPVPRLAANDKAKLHAAGQRLMRGPNNSQDEVDWIVLSAVYGTKIDAGASTILAREIRKRCDARQAMRQRKAS